MCRRFPVMQIVNMDYGENSSVHRAKNISVVKHNGLPKTFQTIRVANCHKQDLGRRAVFQNHLNRDIKS